MQSRVKRIIGFLILGIIVLGTVFLVPFTISLLRGGFEDPKVFDEFQFYQVSAIIGFTIIFLGVILEFIIRKGDDKYGSGVGFFGIGEKPHLKFFKRFTAVQLTFLSLIFFSVLFLLVSTITGMRSFTGLQTLPKEQFGIFDSILFSTFQIPFAENLVAGAVIVIFLILLRIVARKYDMSTNNFLVLAILISLIVGVFGWAWHSSVYPDLEISLLIVFLFWTLGGFLTIITGFFMVFVVMHLTNNLFIDLAEYTGSIESVFIYVIVGLILLSIAYFLIYRNKLLGNSERLR